MVKRTTYAGLYLISLSSLMFEILLTRIFSVTLWYHFAFLAISIAMFGMTAGSLLVYLYPNFFTPEKSQRVAAISALLFSAWTILSVLTHLSMPFIFDRSFVGIYSTVLTYVVISLPFFFSGVCISLILTRLSKQVSRLYAADLLGAASGCLLLLVVLQVTDAPTCLFFIATLGCLSAAAFAWNTQYRRVKMTSLAVSVIMGLFTLILVLGVVQQQPLIKIIWTKGVMEPTALYEKWNSFSRVRVWGDPNTPTTPVVGGVNSSLLTGIQIQQLNLDIDSDAYTPIYHFDGDFAPLSFLKNDVTAIVHYLKPNANVLVIGSGGGRDILAALAFDQKYVTGVELNGNINQIVYDELGDFGGNLKSNPKVSLVVDEARSYITRSKDTYDIIQASMIDTWAATSAGAYALSENSLYTVEGWQTFLDHLSPDGILTFSRWYDDNYPVQMYRLAVLAVTSLQKVGVQNPRQHMLIVRLDKQNTTNLAGLGTLMISKQPFTQEQVDTLEKMAAELRLDVVLSPAYASDPTLERIASGVDLPGFVRSFPQNISAPTDNNPFFFYIVRPLNSLVSGEIADKSPGQGDVAVRILIGLLIIVVCLSGLCYLVPLVLTKKSVPLTGHKALFIYFACIGLGYMLIEISQMQRLIVFLGHPTYSLSIVLFSLLLSSGLGSYSTQRIMDGTLKKSATQRFIYLLSALVLFGLVTSLLISSLASATAPIRILTAVVILFPLGFGMGMAFPMGMKLASISSERITPWLWGINGAASVVASVLAIVLAISFGFAVTFWIGFTCYVIAMTAFLIQVGRPSTGQIPA